MKIQFRSAKVVARLIALNAIRYAKQRHLDTQQYQVIPVQEVAALLKCPDGLIPETVMTELAYEMRVIGYFIFHINNRDFGVFSLEDTNSWIRSSLTFVEKFIVDVESDVNEHIETLSDKLL